MQKQKMYAGEKLARLAKRLREKSGKRKAEMARLLKVSRATMQDAEERPEKNLTKLRCRIIETCSPFKVTGPVFYLERKRSQ